MKNLIVVLAALLLVALPLIGGCGGNGEETTMLNGALPVLEVGDKWVVRGDMDGIETTATLEITGEDVHKGEECYVAEMSVDPPVGDVLSSMTAKMDKVTLALVWMQGSADYMGMSFDMAVYYSRQFTGGQPYPLQVGKEYGVIVTETEIITVLGKAETKTKTNTYTYKVEKIEQITVPAGTFRCFKVVEYNKQGTAVTTKWKSPETKMCNVKELSHDDGDFAELISYSLSPRP